MPRVELNRVVWFSQGVFAFIIWLAMCKRLSVGDQTRVWRQYALYILCGEANESKYHTRRPATRHELGRALPHAS